MVIITFEFISYILFGTTATIFFSLGVIYGKMKVRKKKK